jgi:hypothetical protein
VAYLQRRHYTPYGRALRSCHPRDLLDQVAALCRYRKQEPVISRELIDAACKAYFVDNNAAPVDDTPPPVARPARQQLDIH